ncbi:acyl carrier protein [Saccharopolyspora lacisalsi]|uniref:Acyl carrier protein n=1 Tax=Halosaccharopolyspora lacisalsi TaxID=1000566 RepID=A0A839E2T7_9PSEU|nr:acyl carrier protein [Halosaccharopolyspora lacisalsi]MBA8826065.1 acyl carrier protein [Halosaccharopolyspora lacisalsi]
MAQSAGDADETGADLELLERLSDADAPTRLSSLTGFVIEQAAAILRVDPAGVDPGRSLLDYGLDSLMGLELRTRIDKALRVRVPTKQLWAHPDPESLAGCLAEKLGGSADS